MWVGGDQQRGEACMPPPPPPADLSGTPPQKGGLSTRREVSKKCPSRIARFCPASAALQALHCLPVPLSRKGLEAGAAGKNRMADRRPSRHRR